ncbi:MAG: hypothetical protein IJ735_00685 [Clostridia bacterium]|nr:hypothetical protein [Clostridia bacterium]
MTNLMANFFSQEIILGLTVQEFLLHLLNFVILIVALTLLLYKPVKKFMQKRKETYEKAEQDYETALTGLKEAQASADEKIDEARKEAVRLAEEAQKKALEQQKLIISEAQKEADGIVSAAKEEAKTAAIKSKEEIYLAAKDMAYDVAEKLIARDLKTEDNDAFIDAILAEQKDVQDA